jgi:hypothetical protein
MRVCGGGYKKNCPRPRGLCFIHNRLVLEHRGRLVPVIRPFDCLMPAPSSSSIKAPVLHRT